MRSEDLRSGLEDGGVSDFLFKNVSTANEKSISGLGRGQEEAEYMG
jgi:hypothetical protein